MRIKYNNNKNYFSHYNISQGIFQSKKSILHNPKNRVYSYVGNGILSLLFAVSLFIFMQIFNYYFESATLVKYVNIFLIICIGMIFLYFLIFTLGYLAEKNKNHVGQLIFDKDGIKDFSDEGIVVGVTWDKVEAIVITKKTITIVTSTAFFFFIDISLKNKLLKTLEEYGKNIKIIDKVNR